MCSIEIRCAAQAREENCDGTACRVLVIRGNRTLRSSEPGPGRLMLPGGKMTCGESEEDCIIGTFGLIKPSVCKLEIVVRYADQRKVTRYFFGQLDRDIGSALTERKKNGGTEPVWFPVRAAHELFSKHQPFAGSDER